MNELVRFAMVAFYPRAWGLPGLADLGVDDKIVALRRDSTRLFWFGIVAAAFFFQISPILTVGRPLPAVMLDEEQLDRHAHKLATFPVYLIRQIVVLLKLMGGVFWGSAPEIRAYLELPAYGEDPGTRRLEAQVARPPYPPRAPVPALVQLGRREVAKGRGAHDAEHAEPGAAPAGEVA
jgi:hypothetical protein